LASAVTPPSVTLLLFFFSCYTHHRHLHSFPTRRSSDLPKRKRNAVYAAYSYCRWADDIVDEGAAESDGDPLVRLEEWQRELDARSEEHTSDLQSRGHLVCRLLLEKKKQKKHKNQ